MIYRRDIDGLRAIAVLAVVIYHSGLPLVSGGFLGVDIFFVISGYLITQIIVKDLEQGRFSLLDFYERRARRILPALTVVVLATLVVGWFVLLPQEFSQLGLATISTALFASNMYFYSTVDYFGSAAEFLPLLHTWSLAVEEQFYLIFPILLMVTVKAAKRTVAVVAVAAISLVSLIAAVLMLPAWPAEVFYIIVFRAWELGAGALIALWRPAKGAPTLMQTALIFVALAAIVVPIFVYTSLTPFPGLAAVPPVLGTAVLLSLGGRGGFVDRLLSMRAMVAIGLISYSLYLWHWPIFAYVRLLTGDTHLAPLTGLACIVLAFGLATLSYRFVERPFRAGTFAQFDQTRILSFSVTTLAILISLGLGLVLTQGVQGRISPQIAAVYDVKQDRNPRQEDCLGRQPSTGLCAIGEVEQDQLPRDFLFWGDSHADALLPAMELAAMDAGQTGLFASQPGCLPIPAVRRVPTDLECRRFLAEMTNLLEARSDLSLVILAGRWPLSVEGTRYFAEAGDDVVLAAIDGVDLAPARGNSALLEAGLRVIVKRLTDTGRTVVLLGPTPEVGQDVPSIVARQAMLDRQTDVALSRTRYDLRSGQSVDILTRVANEMEGARYLSLSDVLCDDAACLIQNADGIPLYVDDDHVSATTAKNMFRDVLLSVWD